MAVSDETILNFLSSLREMKPHHFTVKSQCHVRPLGMAIIRCILENSTPEKVEFKPSEVAKMLHVKQPTITPLLFELEEAGLLSRRLSRSDRRVVYISLTENAKALHKVHEAEMKGKIREVIQYLGEEDTLEFIRIVRKISDYVAEHHKGAEE